jgi:hypothetical protein
MIRTVSPGWCGRMVELGDGQEWMLAELRAIAARSRHKSRLWHELRPLREHDRAPSTVHRLVHRLAALGVVAIDPVRGCRGMVRFTFGVLPWKFLEPRRGQLARMRARVQVSFGQLTLELIPPVALTSPPDHAAGDAGSLPSVAGGTSIGQLELRLPRSFEELMALNGSGRRVLGW